MPGKEIKLIKKALHEDGYYYYTTSEAATTSTSELTYEAATLAPKRRPHIKISFCFDKGLIREEEKEEQAAALIAKEEIPTPGFALVKETVEDDYTSSSSSTFQTKLDATKRKMHDSYQQLANAKKQRRIQVIDPRDLPPPLPTQSSSKGKGGALAARKKMINISTTTNRTNTRSNNNLFNGGVRSRLVKPTSIF